MKKTIIALTFFISTVNSFAADSTFYFTTSDNVRLYVRVAGDGKPCLFVHGGPGSTAYYFEATDAAALVQQKMKMIYFDQRGSGRSDSALNNDYSLKRLEKDMEELKTALGFRQWAVMGHSFAGILISNYAKHYPKSVSSLFLIECTLDLQASMASHLEFGLNELNIKDQKEFRDTTKPLNERVSQVHNMLTEKGIWYKLMFRNAYEKQYSDSVTFAIGKFNRDYANKVWERPEYWKDYTYITKEIKCPVFIMTGNKDYAIGPDLYKRYHFPNQTVVHYIGGHAPFQEEPQWFAEKIIAFAENL